MVSSPVSPLGLRRYQPQASRVFFPSVPSPTGVSDSLGSGRTAADRGVGAEQCAGGFRAWCARTLPPHRPCCARVLEFNGACAARAGTATGLWRPLRDVRMRSARPDARPLQSPCALSCPTLSAQPAQDPGCPPVRRCALRRFAAFVPPRRAPAGTASSVWVSGSRRTAAPPLPASVRRAESERRDQALLTQPAAGVLSCVSAPPRPTWVEVSRRAARPDRLRCRRHAEREPPAAAAAARRARAARAPRAGQCPQGPGASGGTRPGPGAPREAPSLPGSGRGGGHCGLSGPDSSGALRAVGPGAFRGRTLRGCGSGQGPCLRARASAHQYSDFIERRLMWVPGGAVLGGVE